MVLSQCLELIVRMIFTLIKFSIENWFWLIVIMGLSFFFSKNPWIFSGVISALDFLMDSFSVVEAASGGFLALLGGIFVSGFLAAIIGFLYGLMLLMSPANLILKVIAFPFFVLLGAVMAVIPYASIPMNFVLGYALNDERIANITCIVPVALFIILALFTPYACSIGNYVLKAII